MSFAICKSTITARVITACLDKSCRGGKWSKRGSTVWRRWCSTNENSMTQPSHFMDQGEFTSRFCTRPQNFAWFLGAGASATAGLPTAADILWDLKRRYYSREE